MRLGDATWAQTWRGGGGKHRVGDDFTSVTRKWRLLTNRNSQLRRCLKFYTCAIEAAKLHDSEILMAMIGALRDIYVSLA